MVESRNQSLDFFKGLMILFVIVGHLIPGSLSDNLFRYLIYIFHMPLFMFLSGFVAAKYNTKKKLEYYYRLIFRIITPWVFAIIVYTLILNNQLSISNKTLIDSFLYPFYHLWYIPTYLLFTIIFEVLKYLKISSAYILFLSFFVFVFCTIYEPNYLSDRNFLYTFRLKYLFYYTIGFYAFGNINDKLKYLIKYLKFIIVLLLFFLIVLFFINLNNMFILEVTKFIFNIALVLLLTFIVKYKSIHNTFVNLIGRESFMIYLWHMIPILLIKSIFQNQLIYYFAIIPVALFIYIYLLYKYKLWKFQK